MRKQSKPAPASDSPDIDKLAEVVQGLTQQVRQLALILDEIREDLVHAVRSTGLDPAVSPGEYQNFLDQVEDAIGEMEETNAPVGTKKIIHAPVEPPKVKPTDRADRSLFE